MGVGQLVMCFGFNGAETSGMLAACYFHKC